MSRLTVIIYFTGLFVLCFVQMIQPTPMPTIISRNEWGARKPNASPENLLVNPPPFIIIHHSATNECNSLITCQSKIRAIQNYHMDHNHWEDIGYNFLIGGDGNVYEGRGWGIKGAHSPKYNAKSLGICFVGNFSNKLPEHAAINETDKLLAYGVSIGNIANNYTLLGHRQTRATDCPGDALYKLIKTWPHWEDIQT